MMLRRQAASFSWVVFPWVWWLCSSWWTLRVVQGWAPVLLLPGAQSSRSCSRTRTTPTRRFMVMDPTAWASGAVLGGSISSGVTLEMGVALVGAAVAGAASQWPRVQNLQQQLTIAQTQLAESETIRNAQIQQLEEKLFAMDQEFEEQTSRFQKQYDQTQRKRLEEIKEKLKTEMQYKLEIQLAQQKSQGLMAALTEEHSRTSKQEQLSQLTLRSSQLESVNAELEATLQKTDEELQRLRETVARKKGRFPFW